MWEKWIKGLEPYRIVKPSQLVWCEDGQRVNSDGLHIPKNVSRYSQGTWELKSVVVLSNAQPFKRGLPTYCWVREVPFYIPQGYVKDHLIYQQVCGRTTRSLGCSTINKWQILRLNMSKHVSNLTHKVLNILNLN